jgi:hypothetical protein
MLKKKLKDGTIVGLSCEMVQGGVLLTLDRQDADAKGEALQQSFMMNPAQVSELIDGLEKQFVVIRSAKGDELIYRNPPMHEKGPTIIATKPDSIEEEVMIFPLHEHEVRFIKKALENMSDSLLFVGTWSGEAELW